MGCSEAPSADGTHAGVSVVTAGATRSTRLLGDTQPGRDLFAGPSVAGVTVPAAAGSFTFIKADRTGYSPGYDVRDANGIE